MAVYNTVLDVMIETIPKKKKCKKAKCLSVEALQRAEKRSEGNGEREGYTQVNAEFQKIARRDKKALSDGCKEIEENNERVKTRSLCRKLKISREGCVQKQAQ